MNKKRYIFAIILSIIFLTLFITEIYECPLKYIFGLSCPFCGVTRAFECLIKLDIAGSFHCHLFWPVILAAIIIHVLYEFNIIKKHKKIFMTLLYVFVVVNFIYYIYRLTSGSDIVYFNWYESFIYKTYKFFIK